MSRVLLSLCCLLCALPAVGLDPRTIAPGVGVGHILLHEDADQAASGLGEQQDGDAAMGHFWGTWYGKGQHGKRTELDIYSVRDESGLHTSVEQVRVTSPYFRTASGISAGSTWTQIRQAFPAIRPVASHAPEGERSRTVMYDDQAAGIAFEFVRKSRKEMQAASCLAVLVHPCGRSVTDEYSAWPYDY